jgi:ABC-type multidrug transport system fused ATPase/permease subunit
MVIGCIASLITGGVQPALAITLSKAVSAFSICDEDAQKKQITLFSILFVVFGATSFIFHIIKFGAFGISGERLTNRLRLKGFQSILKQDMGWFDKPENNVGTLCTKLSTEASAVKGASGLRVGFVITVLSNIGVGIVLAFVYAWAIALCIFGFIPLMIVSGVLQMQMLTGFSSKDKEFLEKAGKVNWKNKKKNFKIENL